MKGFTEYFKLAIFSNTAPCVAHVCRRFGGTYHLNLQG
jgi:hypothetical protein